MRIEIKSEKNKNEMVKILANENISFSVNKKEQWIPNGLGGQSLSIVWTIEISEEVYRD